MDPGLSDFQLHSDFHQGIYVTQGLCVCVRVCAHVIRERQKAVFPPVSQWCWVSKINITISPTEWKQVHTPMGVCVC